MFTQRITTRINLFIKIIFKVHPANHTIKCTQKNLSNKDETPNHEEKGQKHMFLTNKTYLKPHKPAVAMPENGPQENSSWKESVSQPQTSINA